MGENSNGNSNGNGNGNVNPETPPEVQAITPKKKRKPVRHYPVPEVDPTSLTPRLKFHHSPLMYAFSNLEKGWMDWIRFVWLAAKEGNVAMQRVIDAYCKLPANERKRAAPETVLERANVHPEHLLSAIVPLFWRESNLQAQVVGAVFNPRVLKQTAKMAMSAGKTSFRDRELFLKATGTLPAPKGATFNILHAHAASAPSQTQTPPAGFLGPVSSDIEAMDALDDDYVPPTDHREEDREGD